MPREAAGILMFRRGGDGLEVLLVHPGGPYWRSKDVGAWTIPKGKLEDGEAPIDAARREFEEETGFELEGELVSLGSIRQRSGKLVRAWAVEGDADPANLSSLTFEMEWPPRSGRMQTFPEVDEAAFFSLAEAARRILPAQRPLLDRLTSRVNGSDG